MLPAGQAIWNPADPDQFVVSSDDLRVYNLLPDDPESPFQLTSSYDQRVPVLTCISWAPNSIAGGLLSGKVILLNTTRQTGRHDIDIVKQFVPKYSRRCTTLAFNPNICSQFICGLDKVRNACSGLIFDIEQSGGISPEHIGDHNVPTVHEPLVQFSKSESISSAVWLSCLPQCLAVCSGMKWIRLYDIRTVSDPILSIGAHTKSIHSLSVSKINDRLLSAISEDGLLNIWDVRMNQQCPLLTSLYLPGLIPASIQWSTTTPGIVATSFTEKSHIEFYEVSLFLDGSRQYSNGIPKLVAKNQLALPLPIASFDLHPTRANSLIALTADSKLHYKTYCESKAIDFSCFGQLAFSLDTNFKVSPPKNEDISSLMVARALSGYSLDITANEQLFSPESELADPVLYQLWHFLYISSVTGSEAANRSVQACLSRDSDSKSRVMNGISIYDSEGRSQACRLLGWRQIDIQADVDELVSNLGDQQEFEIAVAMAVFHLDLNSALRLLRSAVHYANRDDLSFVCLAFSGFAGHCSSEEHEIWSSTARSIVAQIPHPYLRAAVRILSCSRDTPDYTEILNDDAVNFRDRLAFACRFLSDPELKAYMDSTLKSAIDSGSLDGLFLCGLTPDSCNVLRSYLDMTADIQTVAIISALSFSGVDNSHEPNQWFERCINVYRDLVDRWKLWSYRAKFDIARRRIRPSGMQSKDGQASAACRHCRQSLIQSDLVSPRSTCLPARFASSSATSHRFRVQACPSCKKSLPKCSVCLLSLDCTMTASQRWSQNEPLGEISPDNGCSTDQWISWCMVCHHAGHGLHMDEWFSRHTRCPVTGCPCLCR